MIPQTVPNNPMKGVTAAVIASHGTLRSSRVISSEDEICIARWMAKDCARPGSPHLPLEFGDRAFEDSDQRAGAKLISYGSHVLHALRFSKGTDKSSTLPAGAADKTSTLTGSPPRKAC